MALLETNVKNKIALIQEQYTSINDCTLIHKRDFFSSGTAPPSTTPAGATPATSWTSSRPRAVIYAPGRSDVLPVYRFMTRDIATVATQLGFIASIYMDITKSVRSKELLALLDFCRQEKKTLIMAIDSNSYLFSDCENNRGLEIESLVAEYGLEVHNRGITPTFAGAGLNNTVNYSVLDITLSRNLPRLHKIKDWKVSHVPSGSDLCNITFGYVAGAPPNKEVRLGRNYHRADWDQFRSLVKTDEMKAIISRQTWSKLIIEETTSQWYASVDPAFKKVCPLKPIKVKEQSVWWNEDCEDARKRYQSMYKKAYRQGRPSPVDLKDLSALNRSLNNCIKEAKRTRFQEFVSEVETLPAMAKLSKILKSKPSNKLGLVRKPDGSLSTSPEESLETMVSEHFPGSIGQLVQLGS
jgi:hypothetical protein